MFDPKLTIESGLERIGEIRGGRQMDIELGDPFFKEMHKFRKAMQILCENDAIFWDTKVTRLLKPEFKSQLKHVHPHEEDFSDYWWRNKNPQGPNCTYHHPVVLDEAVMNAVEYGGRGKVTVRHLVGKTGEFYVIGQKNVGPSFEVLQERYENGDDFYYEKGKYPRGSGLNRFATGDESVWYADLDPGYAILISLEF